MISPGGEQETGENTLQNREKVEEVNHLLYVHHTVHIQGMNFSSHFPEMQQSIILQENYVFKMESSYQFFFPKKGNFAEGLFTGIHTLEFKCLS